MKEFDSHLFLSIDRSWCCAVKVQGKTDDPSPKSRAFYTEGRGGEAKAEVNSPRPITSLPFRMDFVSFLKFEALFKLR